MFADAWNHLRLYALEVHDVALSKLERNLERDRDDVQRLAQAGYLKPEILKERYYKELRPN
jgi:G:T-mismatch repair DNA endonuclease (very short patch repair protein)